MTCKVLYCYDTLQVKSDIVMKLTMHMILLFIGYP